MKKLVLAVLAASPLLANADCLVELQYQGTVLGQNVFNAPVCREAMRECKRAEKSYERNHSLTELSCVKVDDVARPHDPTPYPPGPVDPVPPNGNPGPFPTERITVTGKIESTPFSISGRNISDLYNSCLYYVEGQNFGSVDDIRVSVNGHRYATMRASGWWSSAEAICSQIESQVTSDTMMPVQQSYEPITVKGWVEATPININALSMAEVYNTCVDTMDEKNMGSVDDILIAVSDREYQKRRASGWWSTSQAICDQVEDIAATSLNTTIEYRPVSAVGRIESRNDFNFFAESVPALYNQCIEYAREANLGSVDDIYVSINNGRRQHYRASGWWSDSSAICSAIMQDLR